VTSPLSPWSRRNANRESEEQVKDERFKIHESEINVFQQLCLGKHDENAAIEILLDSPSASLNHDASFSDYSDVGPTFLLSSMQEAASIEKNNTFSTASMSTERGSSVRRKSSPLQAVERSESGRSTDSSSRELSRKKAGEREAKRTFLNRFFSKASPKRNDEAAFPVVDIAGSPNENPLPPRHAMQQPMHPRLRVLEDRGSKNEFDDTFRASSTGKWSTPVRQSYEIKPHTKAHSNASAFSERFDSFSNVSSLSGSLATPYRQKSSFQRQQSLGIESIKDIRMCLKEMESQLARASNNGQRVSRHKLVKALFTVADSLDDNEEKTQAKAELEDAMKAVRQNQDNGHFEEDESAESTSDDDDCTYESGTFAEQDEVGSVTYIEASPFNIMSFFGVSAKNQEVMGETLDDLMWNDFVTLRKENEQRRARHYSSGPSQKKSHKTSLQVKDYSNLSGTRAQNLTNFSKPVRTRSWWRNHPSKNGADHEVLKVVPVDEDESSVGSEELPSYLPTSITVKKRKKTTVLESEVPPVSFAQSGSTG
jgi:hypothetical protein